MESNAANSFKTNHRKCEVFNEDANVFLSWAMSDAEETRSGQTLPKKGDVELLAGGPPCQGFSLMNRYYDENITIDAC